MDSAPHETSSFSHSIFSPLQPKHATNVLLTDADIATKSPQMKNARFSDELGHQPATFSPSLGSLSPLTISARDIDGGSMDFTEFCNDSLSSVSDSGEPKKKNMHNTMMEQPFVQKPICHKRGDFAITPRGTSSPFMPVRVRVSASKLREIQSPNSSASTISPQTVTAGYGSTSKSVEARGHTSMVQYQFPAESSNLKPQVPQSGMYLHILLSNVIFIKLIVYV